jgi:hypothetical protein
MMRSKLFFLAVVRTSFVLMTAFTLVMAARVLGGELPPGHPPVEACPPQYQLPPGHPPIEAERLGRLPPGHPPVDVNRLPAGHPPIDDARPAMPIFPQGGTSTI